MVSYYNSLSYPQRHSAANLPYPPQHWFSSNYHPPTNHQFLNDVDSPHHQHMYYNPHNMSLHQTTTGTPDWHSPSHDHYTSSTGQTQLLQHHQQQTQQQQQQQQHSHHSHQHQQDSSVTHLNDSTGSNNGENLAEGLPSPPITVSGSEISSPGAPNASSSPHAGGNRPPNSKSPYYDWMKKPSYPSQPAPGIVLRKTRTKDKYRVVYTDYQRLELEKEYHTSKYITIRRKTELAQSLQLSERQVKIWFQNRRAKERKQNKKRDDPISAAAAAAVAHNNDLANLMDTKAKIEPGLHLQHPLHQMSSMAMGMSPMSLHHSVLHHGHLGVPPPPPPSQHHLHQSSHQQVGALAM